MADQLPARSAQSAQDAHEDLLAALAASRELGPEMDSALAERYLEKHVKPNAVAPRNTQFQQPSTFRSPSRDLAAVGPILGIITYIVILIVSQGALWWTFFIIPMIGGGWLWGESHHGWDGSNGDQRQQHYDRRQARHEARDQYRAWRHGYPYPPRNDGPQQGSAPSSDARTPSDVL